MDTGKTIVFITHNVAEAIVLADRIVVLSQRPGQLSRICPIDLPRPRMLAMTNTSRFIEMLVEVEATIDHRPR